MDYNKLRKTASKILPELEKVIMNKNKCFPTIMREIKKSPQLRTRCLEHLDYFDLDLAYRWASYIGDRDIMIDRITDSEWVSKWNNRLPKDKI